jgi:signal peptidase
MKGRSRAHRALRALHLRGALSVVVYLVLVPVVALFVTSWLLGWRLQVVESGSMQPGIPVGSLIVATPVDPGTVRQGSVIVFDSPETKRQVTHRVTRVLEQEGGLYFETKGDANERADRAPVPASAVRGQLKWHVPLLGRGLRLVAWPTGFVVLVAVPALALVLNEVVSRRHTRGARHCPNCGVTS